jgi:hypothetical protein
MPWWWWIVAIAVLLASRPIEVRLWRAGRISDRTVTILVLSRFPLVTLVAILAEGMTTALGFILLGVSLLPALMAYRWLLGVVREQHQQLFPSRDIRQP